MADRSTAASPGATYDAMLGATKRVVARWFGGGRIAASDAGQVLNEFGMLVYDGGESAFTRVVVGSNQDPEQLVRLTERTDFSCGCTGCET